MKFTKSFLIILVPLALAAGWALGTFACGWGGGHDFGCRIVAPSFGVGAIAALIAGIIMVVTIVRRKPVIPGQPEEYRDLSNHRTARIVFCAAVIIPALLFAVYHFLPNAQKAAYLEGYSVKACESGKPSVPWGDRFSKDECYAKLDMCDEISGGHLQHNCYFDSNSRLRKDKISDESRCSAISDPYYEYSCKRQFAGERGDWQYCETISESSPSISRDLRNSCFTEVAEGDQSQTAWPVEKEDKRLQWLAIRHKDSPELCDTFTGIKRDSCLNWMTMYSETGKKYCEMMTVSQIYKEDCENTNLRN